MRKVLLTLSVLALLLAVVPALAQENIPDRPAIDNAHSEVIQRLRDFMEQALVESGSAEIAPDSHVVSEVQDAVQNGLETFDELMLRLRTNWIRVLDQLLSTNFTDQFVTGPQTYIP